MHYLLAIHATLVPLLLQQIFIYKKKYYYQAYISKGRERKSGERNCQKFCTNYQAAFTRYNDTYAHAPQSLLYRPIARIFRRGDIWYA